MATTGSPAKRGRGRPAIGRETPLERAEILERARRIAVQEGLDALSMRRLATDLGVTPMAIYHHVPNKPALLYAVIEQIWDEIITGVDAEASDLLDWMVAVGVRTRRVWLDNYPLANLAMGVSDVDDRLLESTSLILAVMQAAGFPDVPFAYGVIQNYVLGSTITAANRRTASAYFGRDPDAVLADSVALLEAHDAPADQIGLVRSRFDDVDGANFEPGLRALIAGLMLGPPS